MSYLPKYDHDFNLFDRAAGHCRHRQCSCHGNCNGPGAGGHAQTWCPEAKGAMRFDVRIIDSDFEACVSLQKASKMTPSATESRIAILVQ